MLEIQDFFSACVGTWKTERTYHYPLHNEVERSYTEFNVGTLAAAEKSQISSSFLPVGSISAWTAGASHLPASGGVRGMRVSERLHPPTRHKGAASGRWVGV
jgi:CpeS-like protein